MAITNIQTTLNAPDPKVVDAVERLLVMAKSGELRSIMVVGGVIGGDAYSDWETDDGFRMLGHLEMLKVDLINSLPNSGVTE